MHRFFLSEEYFSSHEVLLPAELSRQITRVLRLKPGIEIVLLDNRENEYRAVLSDVGEQSCTATILDQQISKGEPKTKITLILGLTQREKFEFILQKCTEIGVSRFLPVTTSRSLLQKTNNISDKYPRWRKILQESAEQSHRGKIPALLNSVGYSTAISQISAENGLKLVLWEEEADRGLQEIIQNDTGDHITLLVGPEGGLSSAEVDLAKQAGFISVSLGNRILRMETAAMIASALVVYEKG